MTPSKNILVKDSVPSKHTFLTFCPFPVTGVAGEGFTSSTHNHPVASHSIFNPIAHIVWLENHTLTLKNDTAKHISVKKSNSFHKHLRNFCPFPVTSVQKLLLGKPAMTCFT
jgi:hypothetical protein